MSLAVTANTSLSKCLNAAIESLCLKPGEDNTLCSHLGKVVARYSVELAKNVDLTGVKILSHDEASEGETLEKYGCSDVNTGFMARWAAKNLGNSVGVAQNTIIVFAKGQAMKVEAVTHRGGFMDEREANLTARD